MAEFYSSKKWSDLQESFRNLFQREHCVILAPTIFFLLDLNFVLRLTWRSCCKHNIKCDVFFFIREKKLLTSSEDYGKDLTGVQNLRKKHQRLEAELNNHEARIQVKISFFI